MYVYTHTHTYMYVYTHTHICMYIYIHIHIYGVDGLDAKSCLTLWDPMDCNPPGSSLHWVFQARILEWVAIPYSRGSSWPRDWTRVSCLAGGFFTTEPHEKSLLEILLDLKGEMCLSCWVQRPVFLRYSIFLIPCIFRMQFQHEFPCINIDFNWSCPSF